MNKTKKPTKETFIAKTKSIDIHEGEDLVVLINEQDAREFGITSMDKVSLIYDDKEFVFDANLTQHLVAPGEVGIFRDIQDKYHIQAGQIVTIAFTKNTSEALEAVKKWLTGKKLSPKDIKAIIQDISHNRFTDILTAYFSAIGFFYPTTDEDMYTMTKAMAEAWEMLHFDGIVADKHCMGGVPGNETTMIMIPLLASLGIKMPKTFSKAITTPAATGECVSVLMDIAFPKKEIEQLVKKNNCCLVWWGGLDLAPADEKLIKVAYPLSMQSFSRTVVSIMAKKYAMGITHSLIDIPVWPTAKVADKKTALRLKKKYEYVGKKLGMKMHVELTEALQPIGAGIGAVLQVREVLRVLQQHHERPLDLEQKALHLASKVIEMVGMAKGKAAEKLAYGQLISGKAWTMMQKIITAQHGNPKVMSESLPLAKIQKQVQASKTGKIHHIDLKAVNVAARTLWSPLDLQAWLYLHKKLGDTVKKWEVLYTMYANDESKITLAQEYLTQNTMYVIK